VKAWLAVFAPVTTMGLMSGDYGSSFLRRPEAISPPSRHLKMDRRLREKIAKGNDRPSFAALRVENA
jgi:hypothetical protein